MTTRAQTHRDSSFRQQPGLFDSLPVSSGIADTPAAAVLDHLRIKPSGFFRRKLFFFPPEFQVIGGAEAPRAIGWIFAQKADAECVSLSRFLFFVHIESISEKIFFSTSLCAPRLSIDCLARDSQFCLAFILHNSISSISSPYQLLGRLPGRD
jgi:hypothetical protein